jgi:hypothetical protein
MIAGRQILPGRRRFGGLVVFLLFSIDWGCSPGMFPNGMALAVVMAGLLG